MLRSRHRFTNQPGKPGLTAQSALRAGHPLTSRLSCAYLFHEGGGGTATGAPFGTATDLVSAGGRLNQAVRSGSIWGIRGGAKWGGRVLVHDSDTDFTTVAADSRQILPTSEGCTIIVGFRKLDGSARASGLFGVHHTISTPGEICGAHVPFVDGTVYWDFGGFVAGTSRLSVGGLDLTSGPMRMAFTSGTRGMEIYHKAKLVASNGGNTTRTATSAEYRLGEHNTINSSDLVDFEYFYVFKRQLLPGEILELLDDPFQIVAPSVGGPGTGPASTPVAVTTPLPYSFLTSVEVTTPLPYSFAGSSPVAVATPLPYSFLSTVRTTTPLPYSFIAPIRVTTPLAYSFTGRDPFVLDLTWDEYLHLEAFLLLTWVETGTTALDAGLDLDWLEYEEPGVLELTWEEYEAELATLFAADVQKPYGRMDKTP